MKSKTETPSPQDNTTLLDVYVAKIPNTPSYAPLFPLARNEEIEKIKNETVKKQKYYVWKLLEYGLAQSLGLDVKNVAFEKSESGKWTSKQLEFSLSHSANAVAIAISRKPVGIDIEILKPQPREDRFAEYILTPDELTAFQSLPNEKRCTFLIQKWTAKESTFKRMGGTSFQPRKIEPDDAETATARLQIGDESYILSVTSEDVKSIRLYDQIAL